MGMKGSSSFPKPSRFELLFVIHWTLVGLFYLSAILQTQQIEDRFIFKTHTLIKEKNIPRKGMNSLISLAIKRMVRLLLLYKDSYGIK